MNNYDTIKRAALEAVAGYCYFSGVTHTSQLSTNGSWVIAQDIADEDYDTFNELVEVYLNSLVDIIHKVINLQLSMTETQSMIKQLAGEDFPMVILYLGGIVGFYNSIKAVEKNFMAEEQAKIDNFFRVMG